MDQSPDETFRLRAEGACNRCGREVRGWIAFDREAHVVNSEGFMVFEDGITCDTCLGDLPPSGGYRKIG